MEEGINNSEYINVFYVYVGFIIVLYIFIVEYGFFVNIKYICFKILFILNYFKKDL